MVALRDAERGDSLMNSRETHQQRRERHDEQPTADDPRPPTRVTASITSSGNGPHQRPERERSGVRITLADDGHCGHCD